LSTLCLRIGSQWLEDGTAARRLVWQREQMTRRWRLAQKLLGTVLSGASSGASPHLWLPAADRDLPALCRDAGIEAAAAQIFAVGHGAPDGLRLSLTAAPSQAVLKARLEALAARLNGPRAR
jgi:DNA-binding transcriptional MocR family regulator